MSKQARLDRVRICLDGLSVGDAFGERFFGEPADAIRRIAKREVSKRTLWRWTDDTAMAKSVAAILELRGDIDSDELMAAMRAEYRREPWRGYGRGAHELFAELDAGVPWRQAAGALFGNRGSYGNGGAMRSAPVGAYFAEDVDAVVEAARRSAVVTHAHIDGQAGAIAVAVAAAVAWQTRTLQATAVHKPLFELVLAKTPASATRDGIERARDTPLDVNVDTAVTRLGNGSRISSQDTVPFCLWCIARHPRDYEAALWTTVAALGDRDTTCAIVGGVLALSARAETIPQAWVHAREPLAGMPLSNEHPVGNG